MRFGFFSVALRFLGGRRFLGCRFDSDRFCGFRAFVEVGGLGFVLGRKWGFRFCCCSFVFGVSGSLFFFRGSGRERRYVL